MTMHTIAQPQHDDCDDVVLALQVAAATWRKGDEEEAVKWLRKAADAAFDAEHDRRAIELSKLAADLASRNRRQVATERPSQSSGRHYQTTSSVQPPPMPLQKPKQLTPPPPPVFPVSPPSAMPAQTSTVTPLTWPTKPATSPSATRLSALQNIPFNTAKSGTSGRAFAQQPNEPIALTRRKTSKSLIKPAHQTISTPSLFRDGNDDEITSRMSVDDLMSLHQSHNVDNQKQQTTFLTQPDAEPEGVLSSAITPVPNIVAPQPASRLESGRMLAPLPQNDDLTPTETKASAQKMPFSPAPSVTNELELQAIEASHKQSSLRASPTPRQVESRASLAFPKRAVIDASTHAVRVAVGKSDNTTVYVRPLDHHGLRSGEYEAVLVQLSESGDIQRLF